MVSAQPWYNGGYRANIVTYTLAVISEIVRRQGKAIDYGRVWNAQGINGTFEQALADISKVVNEEIIRPPTGISNISEWRSEEHTSELQSLMRLSYAVFCLTKKTKTKL